MANKINFLTNVPVYSNTGVYGYFAPVYVNSGANSGRYFVSQIETSYFDINQQDYAALTTFNGWYNISSPYATLNDLFQISYNQESDVDLSNRIVQLGEGYNKSINKLNFVNEGIKCKISPATLNETKAFLVFSELRNANSGFFFRNELQEANVDYYNVSNLSISQEYLDNFNLDFNVKRVFENNTSYISNQGPQELPLTGKFDLYDFSETVSGFDQTNNGVQYAVDGGNYSISYIFNMKGEMVYLQGTDTRYNITKDAALDSVTNFNINFGPSASFNNGASALYDLGRYVAGVYLNPVDVTSPTTATFLDVTHLGPTVVGDKDVYAKNIIGTPAYSFLTTLGDGEFQDNVEVSVNLQDYFGSGMRLNKSDYYQKNFSVPYLNKGLVFLGYHDVTNSWYPAAIFATNTLSVDARLYRKNAPTSNQADSTLVWSGSFDKKIMVEENRVDFQAVIKMSDVGDFSTIVEFSIE